MIKVKRVYDSPEKSDGRRILVDRLWPRGLTREKAAIDEWAKDLSPSNELRKWYEHDPAKWPEFQRRYREELKGQGEALKDLAQRASKETITLLFGSKALTENNADALKIILEAL